MDVLKVSTKSNPNSVAGALAGVLRENGKAEIQAIGAGALNQAVKAIAIARGFCCTAWDGPHLCSCLHRYYYRWGRTHGNQTAH